MVTGWIYENNNYFANAKYQHTCLDCGENYGGTEIENTYLFSAGGYSHYVDPTGVASSISHTIKINVEAMKDYESTGVTIKHGTVVAAGESLKTPISIVDGNLVVEDQAIASNVSGTEFFKLMIKVSGVPENTKLNCCAFIAVNSKVYYLCGSTVLEEAEEVVLDLNATEQV